MPLNKTNADTMALIEKGQAICLVSDLIGFLV